MSVDQLLKFFFELTHRWRSLCALAIIALTTACVPAPKLSPQAAPIPHVGLNAWPEELTPVYLAKFLALGANTLRVPVTSRAQADAVLKSVEGTPLSVLLLVETPDIGIVAALADLKHPQLCAIELCNECDLQNVSARDFGAFVLAGYQRLKAGGFRGDIISGGIYTVSDDTLDYLRHASVGWPPSLILGLHWYGDTSDGYLAAVQALGANIAVTEFGQPSRTPQEDRAQAIYLTDQLAAFRRLGAQYALIYQCCSGPSSSNLDNFGVLRLDLSLKGFTFP